MASINHFLFQYLNRFFFGKSGGYEADIFPSSSPLIDAFT